MSAQAIQVRGLGKRYKIGDSAPYHTIRDTIMTLAAWPARLLRAKPNGVEEAKRHSFWALKDVEFDVAQGEVVGIIGRNGAGKSTLLKVLSRITDPTEGSAVIRGRVGSLLEVGTGFHQELTGRENIYMNGALLGMKRAEIKSKLDDIVAFSEMETFLDTPVKRYSSGMYTRLAFAVAAHLETEILIVDEVLAVGDAAFQKKCLGKMGEAAKNGRTVLFVSHNMASTEALCHRVILLDRGQVVDMGSPRDMVHQYLQKVSQAQTIPLRDRTDRQGDGSARIVSLRAEAMDGQGVFRTGGRLRVTLEYEANGPIRNPNFVVRATNSGNTAIFVLESDITGRLPEVLPARGRVSCVTEPLNLTPGRCYLFVRLSRGQTVADRVENAGLLEVEQGPFFESGRLPDRTDALFAVRHEWMINESEAT